jgi:uncharacterized membrane protein YccC
MNSDVAIRERSLTQGVEARTKPNRWSSFWGTVFRFEPARVAPWLALRNAIGFLLPLAVGIAFDMLPGAVVVSTGALNVSYSDSSEPYVQRARRMLAASMLVGLAVFIGTCWGRHPIFI